jgi:hypothetical protein
MRVGLPIAPDRRGKGVEIVGTSIAIAIDEERRGTAHPTAHAAHDVRLDLCLEVLLFQRVDEFLLRHAQRFAQRHEQRNPERLLILIKAVPCIGQNRPYCPPNSAVSEAGSAKGCKSASAKCLKTKRRSAAKCS